MSDATAQLNTSKSNPTCRIKMQAAEFHNEFLEVTQEILKPWGMEIFGPSKNRKMMSLTTLQHEAFYPYVGSFSRSK